MKKTFLRTATALVMTLALAGCNKSAGKLSTPSTFTPPAGAVELKLKWTPGEHIVQDMDMKLNTTFNVPGRPAPVKQDMMMGQEYGLTVVQESADGGHELELQFLRTSMGMDMGGRKMVDYDSDRDAASGATNPVAATFGKMVGAKVQVYLDASNYVDHVDGIQELTQRLSAGAPPSALMPFKSLFNDGYFKQLFSYGRYMPSKPVQPGDTWPVTVELPMSTFGTIIVDQNFTFTGWEKHGERNCARLDFQGTLKNKPQDEANTKGMSISGMDGNITGTSWFDPELGITIDTTMNQDMNMVIQLPIQGTMQSITNEINQTMNIKLASVK